MTVAAVSPRAASSAVSPSERLDLVFSALGDPIRRAILERLDVDSGLVSELADPFDVSLQAVSRHIQVLVRAGLVRYERTGRISRCSLEAGPLVDAAVWMNRYSRYWQTQFNVLAAALEGAIPEPSRRPGQVRRTRRQTPRRTRR
ncbi:MAG: metalloregulator ArsR/SmtB family transcription factor [Vicinamibacterales bacterium]